MTNAELIEKLEAVLKELKERAVDVPESIPCVHPYEPGQWNEIIRTNLKDIVECTCIFSTLNSFAAGEATIGYIFTPTDSFITTDRFDLDDKPILERLSKYSYVMKLSDVIHD